MSFSRLPEELKLIIIGQLSLQDKFTARLVANEWNEVSKMVLKDQKVISTKRLSFRDVWTECDSFDLKCPGIDLLAKFIGDYCPNLTRLCLVQMNFDLESLQKLAAVIWKLDNFTSLELANCTVMYTGMSDADIQTMNRSVNTNLSKLTALTLFDTVFKKSPTEPYVSWCKRNSDANCWTSFGPFAWKSMTNLNHLVLGNASARLWLGRYCGCLNLDGIEVFEVVDYIPNVKWEDQIGKLSTGLQVSVREMLDKAAESKSIKRLVVKCVNSQDILVVPERKEPNSSVTSIETHHLTRHDALEALEHITLPGHRDFRSSFDGYVKSLAVKYKGQLKSFRIGLYSLAGDTVTAICYNCPNLEVLGFGHVDTYGLPMASCRPEERLANQFGFALTPEVIIVLNRLTKLGVLGLNYFSGSGNESVRLDELDIPSLRTLSLCNSSFVTKELVIQSFQANSRLAIEVEDGKFNKQELKEFKDDEYKLVTVPGYRKIPYYGVYNGQAS